MTLFELSATLTLDTSAFESGIEKAKKDAEKFSSELTSSTKATEAASTWNVAKGVAYGQTAYRAISGLAAAVWDTGKDIIATAAEIKAENAQFAATMGDLSENASEAFEKVGHDASILESRLRRVGVKGFTQFSAAGMDATKALQQMETYTQLAADGAAYYDLSLEEVGERIRSFVRGNVEAGEAIGLFTSMADRERRATELFSASWKDLTEAQRQFLLLDTAKEIYDQIGATGQAAREADGWTNIIGNLSEAWNQAKAIMGGPMVEAITPHLERLTTWLTENPEKLEAVGSVLGELAGLTFDGLISLLTFIADKGTAIAQFISSLKNLNSGQVSEGQTFGDATAKQAVDAWTNSLKNGIESEMSSAWSAAQAALGGQEAASTFRNAYEQYLQEHSLEWGAEVPAEWFEGTAEELQEELDAMELGAQIPAEWTEGTEGALQSVLDSMNLSTTVSVSPVFSGFGSLLNIAKRAIGLDTGMDYVPFDEFPARLHEGEAVLTKLEAEEWRKGKSDSVSNGEVVSLLQQLNDNILAMRNTSILLDGEKVGDMVTGQVSRNIANAAWAGRYG